MENKKGSSIFLGVIGVATLIVAIIGATFAYFSAQTNSDADAIDVGSTEVSLDYNDEINTLLKTNLVPAKEIIASYGGLNSTYIAQSGKQCVDDNGNDICSLYEFTIINPTNANQDITVSLDVVNNGFEHLKYKIYEGTTKVVADSDQGDQYTTPLVYNLNANQTAEAESGNSTAIVTDTFGGNGSKTKLSALSGVLAGNTSKTYTMLIWIDEINDKQPGDAGKALTAGLSVTTGNGTGVTGVIGTVGRTQSET